jgi:hypothetical protein
MSDATRKRATSVPNPELIEPALDLSRPELAEVMDRYTPPAIHPRGPVALVVERPGLPDHGIKKALSDEGWTVHTCSGPSGSVCPLMVGEPCELREESDVAIVYVDKRAPSAVTNTLPRLRCASHVASPGVIAIEGSIQSPAFTDRAATVGGLRDPKTIIGVLKRVMSPRPK